MVAPTNKHLPTELLWIIFRMITEDRVTPAPLVSVARTCKAYQRLALDILWEIIPTQAVMFYALPRDVWTLEEENADNQIKRRIVS